MLFYLFDLDHEIQMGDGTKTFIIARKASLRLCVTLYGRQINESHL